MIRAYEAGLVTLEEARVDLKALGTLTIYDAVAGGTVVCTGVSLQKVPDRTFDRTGTNLTYTLLATTITEQ